MDIVRGDVITFKEGVFGGSFRRPKHIGDRTITAIVLKDSYGSAKQQHTFTLRPLAVEGVRAGDISGRETILRKGRNLYAGLIAREPWQDEKARETMAEEKHERGREARQARRARLEERECLSF